MSIKALRDARAQAVEQARAILNAAEAEGRTMNEDETRSFDGHMGEADALKIRIDRMERLDAEERALGESQGRRTGFTQGTFGSGNDEIRSFLLGTSGSQEMTFQFANRALSTGTNTAGGFTVASEYQRELEKALLSFGGARQAARVVRTASGAELPWPTMNDTAAEGRILAENVAANLTDITFGQMSFGAFKYTSDAIVVSMELLQDSAVSLPEIIGTALGERIGRITNRHFTLGTGVGQPQGIVTGATLGVTGSAVATVTYDDLVDLEHSVNSAYRRGAKFVFSDATLREIKKLKDANGNPLWVPGLTANAPDTILGYQYVINDDMADMAADAKSILFGDTSKFVVRDVLDITLLRLSERYALEGGVGFVAFSRHDSRVIDAGTAPIKFLQNAAA